MLENAAKMLEDDIKNRYRTLIYIQYEVFNGKSVEEAFKSFCKLLGDNAMEYHEFDYWFYRFKNENYDLDHDRSKDPKKPELVDIPLEIVEMIIGKLTLEEKLVLRNVSKPIRNLVDNIKYSSYDCYLTIEDDYYSVALENFEKWEEMKRVNWKQSLKDFVIMMNWPKMKLEIFEIDIDLNEQDMILVLETFKSLNHRIPVVEIAIFPHADRIINVLPYLKPGILEVITIIGEDHRIDFNEIVKLDQWKQAKHCCISLMEIPVEIIYHFESIRLFVSRMSVDDVEKLKNALFASPSLESCYVTVNNEDDDTAIRDAFEEEAIPIPETNQLFEIELDSEDDIGIDFTFAFKKTTA